MRYFTIFQDKLHSVNIQDDQSWVFRETLQKIFKIIYTVSRFSFLVRAVWSSVRMNFNRVTLQHNNEFIIIIFCYLMVSVKTMCNLISRAFDTRDIFEYPCKRCSWTMKTNGTDKRLKLQERLLTINKRNIIRWNIYRDNNFHSLRQVLECL